MPEPISVEDIIGKIIILCIIFDNTILPLNSFLMKLLCAFCVLCVFTNCFENRNRPPEVITVKAPTSVNSIIDASDSSYLKISFADKNFAVSILKDSLFTSDTNKLDSFISSNLNRIQSDHILISGQSELNYERFKQLKGILRKYELYRFRIATDSE